MNEKVLAPLASPFPASTCCQRAKSCMVLVSQSARSIGKSWQNYTSFAVTCTHTLVQPIILCIPPNITELNPAKPLRATRLTSSYHVCLIFIICIYLCYVIYPSINPCMHACLPEVELACIWNCICESRRCISALFHICSCWNARHAKTEAVTGPNGSRRLSTMFLYVCIQYIQWNLFCYVCCWTHCATWGCW